MKTMTENNTSSYLNSFISLAITYLVKRNMRCELKCLPVNIFLIFFTEMVMKCLQSLNAIKYHFVIRHLIQFLVNKTFDIFSRHYSSRRIKYKIFGYGWEIVCYLESYNRVKMKGNHLIKIFCLILLDHFRKSSEKRKRIYFYGRLLFALDEYYGQCSVSLVYTFYFKLQLNRKENKQVILLLIYVTFFSKRDLIRRFV